MQKCNTAVDQGEYMFNFKKLSFTYKSLITISILEMFFVCLFFIVEKKPAFIVSLINRNRTR